jgi:hypothetical protein
MPDRGDKQTVIEKRAPRRAGGKGAPPSQREILGALVAKAAPAADKPKEKVGNPKERQAKVAKAPGKDRTEPLNFRVTADFRRAFKRAAAAEDCKKVELLERIFAEWSARNAP